MKISKTACNRQVSLWLVLLSLATSSVAVGAAKPKTAKKAKAAQKYGAAGPSGADQVLSAVYDSSTNTLRVEGGGGGTGTVTSVGLSMPGTFSVAGSPVTTSGTLSVNWAQPVAIANGGTGQTAAANAFSALAPPTSAGGLIYGTGLNSYGNLALGSSGQCLGSNGVTLVWTACGGGVTLTLAGDLSGTLTSQTVVGLQGHSVSVSAPAAGQVLEWNSTANAWTPTGLPAFGTVSSVALTAPSILNVTGSPITGSGTLAVSLAPQNSNAVFAGPASGASGVPSFRTLVGADIPAINLSASGNGGVAGVLGIANGGTGLTAVGSSGKCLGSNGAAVIWQTCGSGTVTSVSLTLPSGLGATGSPVTTSGTLGISMPSGWGTGSLLEGNGANSVATLAIGPAGQCLTSSGTTVAWGACGTSGTATTVQVNGANASVQTPINFQSGGYITVSNPSAGNVQFNFSGPLAVVNGGTGLTTLGSSGQCLGSNGTAMVWQSCGSASAVTLETNGTNNPSQTLLNLVAGSNITLANSGGNVTIAAAAGGLPSSWTVNGTTNAVAGQPVSNKDATTLTLAPNTASPTADIFDVCSQISSGACAGTKYFGVGAGGSLLFSASNLQLGTTGPAPYLYLNGSQGTPAQPHLKLADAAISIPTCSASTATTGGTLAAGTYWFECTYTNSAGETSFQSAFSVPTTGTTSTITIAAPGANVSASGYHVYYGGTGATQPAQTNFDLVTTLTGVCTAGTTDLGGHPTCAPSSNAVFTAAPTTSAINPPTTNTTGAAFIDAWQASGEGVALCLASSTSSSDCVVGGGVALPGGTGLNLTSGATTTANALACFSGSETASQCAANAANDIVGVFIGGQQNSLVQTTGIVTINLAAAATTTYNHFACTNATAGTIVDSAAACASGQQVGLIAQTNASNVTSVPVLLTLSGASGGGGTCSNCVVTNPSAGQTITQSADQPTLFNINSALTSDANSQWGVEVQGAEAFGLRRYCVSCGLALYVDPGTHLYLASSGEIDSQYGLSLFQGSGYSVTTTNNTLDDAAGDMAALGGLGTFVTNASTTGTTLNKLTKLSGAPSTALIAATTDTSGIVGIVVAGAGTSGKATIAQSGTAACAFDGATTAGDYVQISSTTAGDCHDAGATRPSSNEILGRVLSTNAAAGTYNVLVELENE